MKKLVCAKDIEALGARGETVCYVDGDTIVTPSARDAAEERGIVFSEQTPVSGTLDASTVTAVRRFQALCGLPVTVEVDRHTWRYLCRHYTLAAGNGTGSCRRGKQ